MFFKSIVVVALAISSVSALPLDPALIREDSASAAKCPEMCTMEYKPVCAISTAGTHLMFGNACALFVYNCKHPSNQFVASSQGECLL
ncbi:MAG: hypothetical protein BYD32DRAFT_413367 [Podila humilis]|nr:MAG: hypothetical protein BYD32DRAFT_413367 [Podila humilis]